MDRVKVFIDTDMGLDVDDAIALTLAAYSPEIEILGVSTIFGDTRAREAGHGAFRDGTGSIAAFSRCAREL